MRVHAYAKVNLSLHVGSVRADGLHALSGLFTSISWHDDLHIDTAENDAFEAIASAQIPDGEDNLSWRAAVAVRQKLDTEVGLAVQLGKRIPAAAGLGGGSADAAATLAAIGRLLSVDDRVLGEIAFDLGSDVPFCLVGGFALVEGAGELVLPLKALTGFAMAVVVPPIELSSAMVFAAWDRLGSPEGLALADSDIPPTLRSHIPLRNDLTPAAIDVAPVVADWRSELEKAWGRSVAMSGSGASLFGYFLDVDEAKAALEAVPIGARGTRAVVPVPFGWTIEE